ncbi:MAG: acetate--CoA ligase family protein [Acidobacteria bacterium]|nr:acetate--CoA ligase family protein [Acidobacteriota bacterium]
MARKSATHSLEPLMRPRSVAVVGASRKKVSIGREILRNLVAGGFTGPVFPVNTAADSVYSMKAYRSVEAIPDPVDLAVIVVPKQHVLKVVRSCGRKKVKALVVITAGFRESGEEGAAREKALAAALKRYGMRMVGPNCMGIINTEPGIRLNASFANARPVPGKIGFLSQSGALGEAILSTAAELDLGLAQFVSLGNKTNVSGNDLLEYWENDPDIELILMYLESFGSPRRFTPLARRITRTKPILVVKSGRTAAGARAAVSHTGALTGTEIATDTLLRQCGVIRVDTMQEMFTLAMAFAHQPMPSGNRVAVVTNAGGPGILATDALIGAGVQLASFSAATRSRLRKALPPEASGENPVDMIASADGDRYTAVLGPVLADRGVDAALVIFVTPVYIDALKVAEAIVAAAARTRKTVLTCFMGKTHSSEAVAHLKENSIPVYSFPENACRALTAMIQHQEYLERPGGKVTRFRIKKGAAAILRGARKQRRELLTFNEARALIDAYGLPLVPTREVTDAGTALTAARELGYPVVLKASSDRFPHKTEVGAVRLDLRTGDEVASAFEAMAPRLRRRDPAVRFHVQSMVRGGVEVILGAVTDPAYGPILMFGLGGTEVEVLRDVAYALCPVTDKEAQRLIRTIRGAALLTGFRGSEPVDLDALARWIGRLSQLLIEHPEIQEVDLNPIIVNPRGRPAGVVDARIRVELPGD